MQGNLNYLNVNQNVHIWHQDFTICYLPEVLKDFLYQFQHAVNHACFAPDIQKDPALVLAWPFTVSCPHPIDYINPLVCSFFN